MVIYIFFFISCCASCYAECHAAHHTMQRDDAAAGDGIVTGIFLHFVRRDPRVRIRTSLKIANQA